MEKHIETYAHSFNQKLQEVCGYTEVDLEGRFEYLRSQETNIGNWITDVIRTEFDECQFVILNAGSLRSNSVTQKGDLN